MRRKLPSFTKEELCDHLRHISPTDLTEFSLHALFQHYDELRRWSSHTSLIGPGTLDQVLERHYGESLAALPLLRATDQSLVDVGSGAGFPGWILAAARPGSRVTLVEPRSKKIAFLRSATLKSGLSCNCLGARVGPQLPQGLPGKIDVVTCRALKMSTDILGLVAGRYPGVRFLLWQGGGEPALPTGMKIQQEVALPGSRRRRILDVSFGMDNAEDQP